MRAVVPLLAFLAWGAAATLHAAPAPPSKPDADVPLDPNIAKASAEADAAAHPSPSPESEDVESPQTPYQKALLNYKSGKYEAAKVLIDRADQETPGDVPVEMLKARILTELKDFAGARQVLNSLYDRSDLTPAYAAALALTSGDVALRQHHFDAATKSYQTYLLAQPHDTDATLKLIYARLGVGDLVTAGRLASELKPLDATNPAYYFAHAAITRSNGDGDGEQDIEQARTIYGIHVANRYLKTYLEVFSDEKSATSPSSKHSTNAAPSGRAQ